MCKGGYVIIDHLLLCFRYREGLKKTRNVPFFFPVCSILENRTLHPQKRLKVQLECEELSEIMCYSPVLHRRQSIALKLSAYDNAPSWTYTSKGQGYLREQREGNKVICPRLLRCGTTMWVCRTSSLTQPFNWDIRSSFCSQFSSSVLDSAHRLSPDAKQASLPVFHKCT